MDENYNNNNSNQGQNIEEEKKRIFYIMNWIHYPFDENHIFFY